MASRVKQLHPTLAMEGEVLVMRVHVAVVGLVRALSICLPRIHSHILSPLQHTPGIHATISLYLSRSQVALGNPRTREFDVPEYEINSVVGKYDHELVALEDIRTQVGNLNDEAVSYGEWLGGDGRNIRNYLEFLRLLSLSRGLMESYSADAYIFVRPDLFPVDTFIPFPGVSLSTRKILTPRWGRWGGLNDRFAVVPRRYTNQYFSRIDTVPEYLVTKGPLRPEHHLKWTLQKVPFSAQLPFELVRVRTGGVLEQTDLSRLAEGGRRAQRRLDNLLELVPFKGQGRQSHPASIPDPS